MQSIFPSRFYVFRECSFGIILVKCGVNINTHGQNLPEFQIRLYHHILSAVLVEHQRIVKLTDMYNKVYGV